MENQCQTEFNVLFQPPALMKKTTEDKVTFIKKSISLYIHIPFCEKKCFFCSIVTCQKYNDNYIWDYVNTLLEEINAYRGHFSINNVNSIHIGGGTPSLLSLGQIKLLFSKLKEVIPNFQNIEVVFESEAASFTNEKIDFLSELKNISFSMGVQSFDDHIKKKINRKSRSPLVIDRIKYASEKNFRSIGIDIMCNLPGSTLETTLKDIDIASELGVDHIALYPLRVEPDSVYFDYSHKNKFEALEKTDEIKIYSSSLEYLKQKGYEHYSIFHFNKKGAVNSFNYGRHQVEGGEWIGFGVAAYSYYNGLVFANSRDIDTYINSKKSNISNITLVQSQYNKSDEIVRKFLMSLRGNDIPYKLYEGKFGKILSDLVVTPLINYLKKNRLIVSKGSEFKMSELGIVFFPEIEEFLQSNYKIIIESKGLTELQPSFLNF